MRTLVAIGHGPGGLGGIWRPMAWMPAIDLVRARLAELAAEGPVRVVCSLEAGFPLMAAAAALIARDEGLPVSLDVVLAHPLPDEEREPRAILTWTRRALARADQVRTLFPRAPRSRAEAASAQQEQARAMLAGAERVLACWNGRRGNRTWVALQQAQAHGVAIENLYPDVAQALRLGPPPPAAGASGEGTGDLGLGTG